MYNVEWDTENNGIRLVWAVTPDTVAVFPRPVFKEELDLFGFNKHWEYPDTDQPLCWACERRYFYKGILVAEMKGGGLYESPELRISEAGESLVLEPINVKLVLQQNERQLKVIQYEALQFILSTFNQYSRSKIKSSLNNANIDWERLAEIEEKITKSKHVVVQKSCGSFDLMPLSQAEESGERIIHHSNIQKFIVSFSGGKDSQVVLDLVSQVVPPDSYEVIYSDTGYEFPSSLSLYDETIHLYKERFPELSFELVRNHQDIMSYWNAMGPPSRMLRWCCAVMKTAPIYRHLKIASGLGKQPNVLVFEGVRAEESARRAAYLRLGKGVKHNNVINARPIFDWNSTEVYLYLLAHNLPINKAYRLGCSRVGCIICPYSSQWSETVVKKCFPDKLAPFLKYLRDSNIATGVQDIECYLNDGKWKMRGGSKHLAGDNSKLDVITSSKEVLEVLITQPKENFFEWLKTLGHVHYVTKGDTTSGTIKIKDKLYSFTHTSTADGCRIIFNGVKDDPALYGHIMRVLNKTAYCVHCEACEVECPQGALSVVPSVKIDSTKCISCKKCLDFKDKGCMMAKSLGESQQQLKTMNVDRYNTFGLQENWLKAFLGDPANYFTSKHGLNVKKQVPALATWLRESLLISTKDKQPTELAFLLKDLYIADLKEVWKILWINLCYNSNIVHWFASSVGFDSSTSPKEMINALTSTVNTPERTAKNGIDALLNIPKNNPYSFGLIKLTMKGRSVEAVSRYVEPLSPMVIAYSLYKYAEQRGISQLTVDELYLDEQEYGPHREFGVSRNDLEKALRSLQEQYHLLTAELNMGLGNIFLNADITPNDVIKSFSC